jgi:hypothetical protein
MTQRFKVTFIFEHESPSIDVALQVIQIKIFSEEGPMEVVPVYDVHRVAMTIHELLECYNVAKEEHDKEDPRNVKVPEIEGEWVVEGLELESVVYTQPIRTRKVNIGMTENPKFAQIGDCWSDETIYNIADLHEYQELFPNIFLEIKGISRDLGEMEIPLKTGAKTVRQRPYRLNPKYKEKVKAEIDRMLDATIIEIMVELEWISPMVRKDKKTRGIMICIDLRKFNDACLLDPFPTPFIDEVMENIGGKENYSFTDGFLVYHQIKIA